MEGLAVGRLGAANHPTVVRPEGSDVELVSSIRRNHDALESLRLSSGAILFRGFAVDSVDRFRELSDLFIQSYMAYDTNLTPREQVTAEIALATLAPPDASLEMHSEFCIAGDWPRTIAFNCAVAATRGGETPIADNRGVVARL